MAMRRARPSWRGRARAILTTLSVLLLAAAAQAAPSAREQVARLGRGVNILDYDPLWQDRARARFQPHHFRRIAEGGFRHVRVNLQAFAHMDAANRLAPAWLATLDDIIRQAREAGLMVILDEHDFRFCGKDAAACRVKLLAFWQQVAERYAALHDSILFEILNEPNRALTAQLWNALLAEALAVIRRSNPTRTVVIGPASSNGFRALDQLDLPQDDDHIIATVHYYNPFSFTHQGARFTTPSRENLTGIGWGSGSDRAAVEREFDVIAAWSARHKRPILLGEFGAYDRAAMADRAAWTAAVARAAEARGFAWSYWQFTGNFELFDLAGDAWVEPIHRALVPR